MAIPKTHTIKIDSEEFTRFADSDYIILKTDDLSVGDYVLFAETITSEDATVDSGQFRMTSVKTITESDGLKDGYMLITVNKL